MIVPNDPPQFTKCIALAKGHPDPRETRAVRASASRRSDRLDSVLDFLIKAYWYQADAAKLASRSPTHRSRRRSARRGVDSRLSPRRRGSTPSSARPARRCRTSCTASGSLDPDRSSSTRHTKAVERQAQIAGVLQADHRRSSAQETRNLKIVLTSSQAQALAAQAALSSAARATPRSSSKYSIDPTTKSTGGVLNGVARGEGDAALATRRSRHRPTASERPGQDGQFGYYVFEVTKIAQARSSRWLRPRALIKQQLTSQAIRRAPQQQVSTRPRSAWLDRPTKKCAARTQVPSGYQVVTGCPNPPPVLSTVRRPRGEPMAGRRRCRGARPTRRAHPPASP